MIARRLLIISFALFPLITSAHNLVTGQRLAPIGIEDKGELNLLDKNFSYTKWNSAKLPGKVRVVQHMAGRSSAKEMNAPLVSAIRAANLPRQDYQTTTIVNTDDAIIGTGMFVSRSIEGGKEEFPWSQVIVDSRGIAKKAWQLEAKSSAIIVLDKNGMIRFVKEGALTSEEIQKVTDMLHQLVKE